MSQNNYLKMLDDAQVNENEEFKARQKTIYPYQVIYLCWKQLISICAILILIEIPFELFFGPEYYNIFESDIFTIYRSFIAVLLFFDILLSFNVQYLDEGRLVKSRQEIAEHYVSELFIFDIVPLGIVVLTTFYIVPIWVQLFFLLKIKSIGYTDMVTQEQLIYHKNWLTAYKYLRIIVIMCYTFHFYGCIFYGIGFYSEEIAQPTWINFSNSDLGIIMDYEWLSRYIITTYWAVETLVTTGYGQITALNSQQIIVADLVQVSGMFLVLFVVSSINMLQDNEDRNQQFFFAIQKFMKAYKISRSTKQEIIIYLKFYIDQVKKRDLEVEQIVEARLPKDLRKVLLFQAFRGKLQQIQWLFNLVSEECLMELCTVVRETFYIAQFDIFQNESELNLYLVLKGDVELKLNKSQISIIPIGQSFGEYSFITDQRRTCQALTFTYCQLLLLSQSDFLRVLRKFPKDYQRFSILREQVQINQRLSLIGLSCFLCQKQSHVCSQCPLINLRNKFKKHTLIRHIETKKLRQMQIIETEMLDELMQSRESYYSERSVFVRYARRLPFVKMRISEFQMKKYEIQENCCLDIDKAIFINEIQLETHNAYQKATINLADVIQDLSSPFDIYEMNTEVLKFLDRFFPIIEPRTKWFRRWKYLIQFISVWIFIGVPMVIFYEQNYYYIGRSPVLYIIRLIVGVILFIDICLEFRVDYYKRDKIVSSRKAIAINYLSSYFIFDFIPFMVIVYFTVSDSYILLHLLILLRLVPFYRIEQNLMQKLRLKPSYEMVYLMLRMFIEVIYLNHFFGCLFYGAGAYVYIQYPEMKTWVNDQSCNFGVVMEYSYFKKYILATYWAMNALTTVGYGDIVPLNVVEMIITNLASISAIMLVAINISNILTMKCQLNQSQFAEENYCIQQFMIQKGCSKTLRKDVENYLRNYFMFYNNRDIHLEQQSFQMLPVFLKQNLLYEAYSKIFSTHWFNHQFDHDIHLQMTQSMLEGYYSPMDILFYDKTYDSKCSIYFIQGGCVELFLNPKDPKCLVYLKKGAIFGDFSFVTGMTRLASARTTKYSQLISLQRKDFIKIMQQHHKQYKRFIHMKNQILFNKQFILLNISCYTCNSTDHTSISCPLTQYDPNTNQIIFEKNRISMMTYKEQDRYCCQRSINRKKTHLFQKEIKSLHFILERTLREQSSQSFFLEKSEINYDIDIFKE